MFKILFILITCSISLQSFSQIGIGTMNPHSSAILDIESITKGFLVPRLSSHTDVQSPIAEGLIIYDISDGCLNVYNNTNWVNLCENTGGSSSGSTSISTQGYILKSENPITSGAFGSSMAISDDGKTIAIGTGAEASINGAVYILQKTNDLWVREELFTVPNQSYPRTSLSISDDGNTVAIGYVTSETIYNLKVMDRTGSTWAETINITQPITSGLLCETMINGDGNIIIVGNTKENTGGVASGAVFIYEKSTLGVWSQRDLIKQTSPVANKRFGTAISISDDGNKIAVSEGGVGHSLSNSVIVYKYISNNWVEEETFMGTNLAWPWINNYGQEIALSGNGESIAITQQNSDVEDGEEDAFVDVFRFNTGNWSSVVKLEPVLIDATDYDYFGSSMDFTDDGNTLIISSKEELNGNGLNYITGGLAFVFKHDGTNWTEDNILRAQNRREGNLFGSIVKLSGTDGSVISVSDINEDGIYDNSGAVYIFD